MRLADAGARTWLLAALAAWAVCVWGLALFGMAGSIGRLDEDAALARPLPATFRPGPERLGPLPQYAEAGARPMFTEDRRPQPYLIDPMAEEGEGGDFDFVLTSVLRTPTLQMAILQPTGGGRSLGVKVGESPEGVSGWSLASVGARNAVFNGPEGERTLELRQFDGVGGEAPTAVSVTHPAGGAPTQVDRVQTGANVAPVAAGPGMPQAPPPPGDVAESVPPAADASGNASSTPVTKTSQEQVEAIRKRIEERRARLRQQAAQQNQPGNQTP